MADLTEQLSSQAVKITGASSSGLENNYVTADANGNLFTNLRNSSGNELGTTTNPLQAATFFDVSGTSGAISVSTTAVAVRVGGSNLTNRKVLTAHNNGTAALFWGFSSGVTTTTGTPIQRNQFIVWEAGPNVTVYLIAASGTHDVRVSEAS